MTNKRTLLESLDKYRTLFESRLTQRLGMSLLCFFLTLCFREIPQILVYYAKEFNCYAEEITLYAPFLQFFFQKMQLNTAHN